MRLEVGWRLPALEVRLDEVIRPGPRVLLLTTFKPPSSTNIFYLEAGNFFLQLLQCAESRKIVSSGFTAEASKLHNWLLGQD